MIIKPRKCLSFSILRWLHVRKSRLVLGIETSCDDTGAAVVNDEGIVLGEALNSQKEFHAK